MSSKQPYGNDPLRMSREWRSIEVPEVFPKHPLHNDTAFGIAQDASLKTLNATKYPSASALSATANVKRYVFVGTQNEYTTPDNVTELLRWAMNNVSNTHGSETTIGKAVDTARLLGWPSAINETVEVPVSPPFAWNYSAPVLDPGGPGRSLGTLAEAIVSFQEGDVVEFVLQNARSIGGVAEFHPWHAHGHSVWEVGHGQGIFNADVDVAQYNLVNPVLRDTISLQPLGWVAVRFVADNPGAWLFHCHILSHQIMGIGFVMVVEPGAIQADTPASVQFCNDHYLLEGGEGAGAGGETSDNKTSSAGAVAVVSSSHWWAIITVVFVLVL